MTSVNLEGVRAHIEVLRYVREREAELAELKANSRAVVEAVMGENETGTLDGDVAVTWKRSKRTALDQKALREAEPDTFAAFKTTTEVRRFEVVD